MVRIHSLRPFFVPMCARQYPHSTRLADSPLPRLLRNQLAIPEICMTDLPIALPVQWACQLTSPCANKDRILNGLVPTTGFW